MPEFVESSHLLRAFHPLVSIDKQPLGAFPYHAWLRDCFPAGNKQMHGLRHTDNNSLVGRSTQKQIPTTVRTRNFRTCLLL